jgi:hypothetical protein
MLFPFLKELDRDRFNDLPWVLQQQIADFHPNVPSLPDEFWEIFHTHIALRYCGCCGRYLPKWNKNKYHCLCTKRYSRQRYHPPMRKYATYMRPFHVFTKPSTTEREYQVIFNNSYEWSDVVISSNQQEFVYSFRQLLRKNMVHMWLLFLRYDFNMEKIVWKSMEKRVNTNTCLRSFLDSFGSYFLACHNVVFHKTFGLTRTQNTGVWCPKPHHIRKVHPPVVVFSDFSDETDYTDETD